MKKSLFFILITATMLPILIKASLIDCLPELSKAHKQLLESKKPCLTSILKQAYDQENIPLVVSLIKAGATPQPLPANEPTLIETIQNNEASLRKIKNVTLKTVLAGQFDQIIRSIYIEVRKDDEHYHSEIVALLTPAVADLDKEVDETTLLIEAAKTKKLSAVQILLTAGADINKTTSIKTLPLHFSSPSSKRRMTQDCALSAAMVPSFNYHVVQFLLKDKNINPNVTAEADNSPLKMTIERTNIHAIKAVIEAGADVNRGKPIFTALRIFNSYPMVDIVKILIKAGLHINARDENGNTPLMLAAEEDYEALHEFLQLFLAIPVAPKTTNVVSLVQQARKGNCFPLRKFYSSSPAPHSYINFQNKEGNTALMLAAKGSSLFAIQKLLKRPDIKTDIKNNQNKTALDIARETLIVRRNHLQELLDENIYPHAIIRTEHAIEQALDIIKLLETYNPQKSSCTIL